MKKKIIIPLVGLLLFSTVAFSQEYNQESIDSLIQSKVQSQVSRNSKFLIGVYKHDRTVLKREIFFF